MNQFAWSVFSGVVVYVFWIQMCYLILEKKRIVGRMWSDFNSIWCKAILEERKIKVSFSTTGKYIFVVFGIAAIQWMFRCNTCHTFLVSRVTDWLSKFGKETFSLSYINFLCIYSST